MCLCVLKMSTCINHSDTPVWCLSICVFVYFENENDTHVVECRPILAFENLCVCVFCILKLSSCIKSISMTHCVIDTGPNVVRFPNCHEASGLGNLTSPIVDQTKVDMPSL